MNFPPITTVLAGTPTEGDINASSRTLSLSEAASVLSTLHNDMDWFNLLSPATGLHMDKSAHDSSVGALLSAAGMVDLAGYADRAEHSANETMNRAARGLDEVTDWFDHYSKKYLGTVPGIDGEEDSTAVGRRGGSVVVWEEYEPEFGAEDVPEWQLEELPEEIGGLDLTSVEEFLRGCGMLGMRFEDRGGGFRAMREKAGWGAAERRRVLEEQSGDELIFVPEKDDSKVAGEMEDVPEIFFSPYFDLTDPVCFEKLLVVSDEEVAEIRAREAVLHALAERKVREAEEVAKRDAENGMIDTRHPRRQHGAPSGNDDTGGSLDNLPDRSGPSMTTDARRTNSPIDENVITLRKPETFTTHLDTIELALLDQVRSKSDSFFRETTRFSELQQLVTASVDEVRSLLTDLQSLRERCVTNVEFVPIMDDSRKDLGAISRVLEAAEDVVNSRASIASLISARDHLGAVEAIRLARSLLSKCPDDVEDDNMTKSGNEKNDVSTTNDEVDLGGHLPQHKFCLGKLKSLSKVGEQLNEYEKLVVRNLTDELVDTFLSWGSSQPSGGDDNSGIDYGSTPRIALSFERRSNIRGVVQSLRLCGQLSVARDAYQKRLCELISVTVKAIVTENVADAAQTTGNGNDSSGPSKGTVAGVANMSLEQFIDCINMLFEQVLGLLWGAVAVNKFCIEEGIILEDKTHSTESKPDYPHSENTPSGDSQHKLSATAAALAAAADLAEKSVSELLRLRREAHSLVSFDGMRQLWDTSLTFTLQLERFSGRKAYGLRSTLLAQAKSFVERKHEANMSTLVAALDSERWIQCSVSVERQAALNRLCSGRAAFTSRNQSRNTDSIASPIVTGSSRDKMIDATVEGVRFKVVWSCLLLLEMVMDDVACAAHFQTLATNVVGKVAELFRLFNTRSTHLVLGAGAIHSAARLKSINAKHLSIVTQCIGIVLVVFPHVRAALMAQLPPKQYTLLSDLDKIKQDYTDHNEKILGKLVSIIGGIVEHSLAAKIPQTKFDLLASTHPFPAGSTDEDFECSVFIDSVVTNTKKMHQVLSVMLPPELLRDVFSRIFAYLDHKVPSLYKDFSSEKMDQSSPDRRFVMPSSDQGKRLMVKEVEYMTQTLNCLPGVQPWHFTAMRVLEQELDIKSDISSVSPREESLHPSQNGAVDSEFTSDEKKETEFEDDPQSHDVDQSANASTPLFSSSEEDDILVGENSGKEVESIHDGKSANDTDVTNYEETTDRMEDMKIDSEHSVVEPKNSTEPALYSGNSDNDELPSSFGAISLENDATVTSEFFTDVTADNSARSALDDEPNIVAVERSSSNDMI